MTFSDAALQTLDSIDPSAPMPTGTYQPREPFGAKFNNGNAMFGNWTLQFVNDDSQFVDTANPLYTHDFHLTYNATLTIKRLPNRHPGLTVLQQPPTIDINDTTNKLEIILHNSFFSQNNYIAFSPKLNSILGFPTYIRDDGNYVLKIAQVIRPVTNPSYATLVQPESTVYRLVGIRQLQLRTSSLAVSGERDVISGTPIIMSVDVTTGSAKDSYEFQNSTDTRFYDILSSGPMYQLNLSLFVRYQDGTITQALIPPYSEFSCLIKFVRKNRIVN
jgi:hypothetical protein